MFPIDTETLFERREPDSLDSHGPERLVSVIVTLFEHECFLAECLDSVAAQQHKRLELVIVDDGSIDGSATVAREWLVENSSRFERAILLKQAQHQGLSQARNAAFEAARADHVFVLDADSMIYPRAIGRLLEAIEDTKVGVAYSQIELFGAQSRLGFADEWRREFFEKGNYVDAMALVSKAAWETVGGYTQMDPGWEAYEFWCKFIEHGIEGLYVPEILCRRRVHGSPMSEDDAKRRLSRLTNRMMLLHPWVRPIAANL
jgi:glycosyltransferase involved in cell wall biosynthesis